MESLLKPHTETMKMFPSEDTAWITDIEEKKDEEDNVEEEWWKRSLNWTYSS